MSKFILVSTANANLILDWQDDALFSYAEPVEGYERHPVTDEQWKQSDQSKQQGYYNGEILDWIAPPEAPEGKEAVWDGATWQLQVLPPPPAPESLTMRQAKLVLLHAGLLQAVEQAIANMPGVAGEAARIEWEYATFIERSNPLFALLSASLGLTDTAIDDLFRQGAAI